MELNKLSKAVENNIKSYDMLGKKNKRVPVAFSGGKDSLFLVLALQSIGFKPEAIIIDRNDRFFDASEIANTAIKLNIHAKIINLRDENYLNSIPIDSANQIQSYLSYLDEIGPDDIACTPCYNARALALGCYALSIGVNFYVIGTHKTDMITSLMKFYWIDIYYHKFTEKTGQAYEKTIMEKLIAESEIDFEYLSSMVDNKLAATDDPPIEQFDETIKIVKPLSGICERDIKNVIDNLPVETVTGNCEFLKNEANKPYRLIVQDDLKKRIDIDESIEDKLHSLCLKGLNKDGTLKFRPRNHVEDNYPGFEPRLTAKL